MANLSQEDSTQYQILNDRLWRYNDLLWKNFLAYGAVLATFTTILPKSLPEFTIITNSIGLLASMVLLCLALIQSALLGGLHRNVVFLNALEVRTNIAVITKKSEDVCCLSVQTAYKIVIVGMFIIAGILVIAFFLQLIKK